MRISDWSSDVCSSDLDVAFRRRCQHDIGAADRTDITRSRHGICDRRPGSSRAGRHDRSDPACRECGCAPPPRPRLPPRVTALPPLRQVIAQHGLSASKALGQNFLFDGQLLGRIAAIRSEEHTSELQSLMRISYAVFCLKKKKTKSKL